MKKAIAPIALILLVFIGGVAAYVATNPGAMGGAGKKEGESVAKKAETAAATPASTGFDRKAAAAKTEQEATTRRPPPKKGEVAERPVDDDRLRPARRGRMIGEVTLPAGITPPPPELYPFQVVRRSFPDANTIAVELAVQNSSGSQWKSAYVVIRSSQHPISYQFEVTDWQIDEVVGLEYTFPKVELEQRVDKLRIVAVLGDKRDSALAEMLSQSRRKLVEASVANMTDVVRTREGDTLTAPGLLSVLGRAQEDVTGIVVKPAAMRAATEARLKVAPPTEPLIERDLALDIRETSEDRLAAAQLARQFHKEGVAIQDSLARFCTNVSSAPFGEAMSGPAKEPLDDARTRLATFNDLGVKLATTAQRSKDVEIRALGTLVGTTSAALLTQIEEIETKVRAVDPHFRVQ